MRRWEYKLQWPFNSPETVINKHACEGWEYVGRIESKLLFRRRCWRWKR